MPSFLDQPISVQGGVPVGNEMTWGNLLGALQSSSPTQKQQPIIPTALPTVTQQGNIPVYNTPMSLPTQQKKKDSTGEIVSLLLSYFGLGG